MIEMHSRGGVGSRGKGMMGKGRGNLWGGGVFWGSDQRDGDNRVECNWNSMGWGYTRVG